MQTRLSVNINKVATLRNSRGGNLPDLVQFAIDCETYGAEGITVHPRPDERHIRYTDVPALKKVVTTEYNIEGYPNPEFLELVVANKPTQCTLVPDAPGVLTSDSGWDTIKHEGFLKEVIANLQKEGIRVSLFLDPEEQMVHGAQQVGADRIEFYTGTFAKEFETNPQKAVEAHTRCAILAASLGLGLNAGHDLNLHNLKFYKEQVPELLEVSIGHAIISDSLYFGIQNVIQMYLRLLK